MFFKRRPVFLSEGNLRGRCPELVGFSASVLAGNDPATAPLASAKPGHRTSRWINILDFTHQLRLTEERVLIRQRW